METRLAPLASILALNTDLALNCLDGVSEDQALRRLPGGGNSLTFLLAHVADVRFYLLNLLGSPAESPLAAALSGARSIDDIVAMPRLGEVVEAWSAAGRLTQEALEEVSESRLNEPVSQSFPIQGGTLLDAVSFLTQHDTYHVGQMAFVRRQLGFPAMRYDR